MNRTSCRYIRLITDQMGGSMSKSAAQQAVKVSARTVLARRAADQQRPWAEGALRPLPHYHPNAPVATVGEEEQLMDPDLLKKIATTEMVKTKIETVRHTLCCFLVLNNHVDVRCRQLVTAHT